MVKIGEDVSERLDVEPAKFFVHRPSPQYACKGRETITAAPGLLAWVLTRKCLDHLPLYRLEQIAARQQVTLARSTLAEEVGRTGVAL